MKYRVRKCKSCLLENPCKRSFCSLGCYHDFLRENKSRAGSNNPKWKGGQVEITCKICESIFKVDLYRKDTAKCCSKECITKYKRLPANRKRMSNIMYKRVKSGNHNMYKGLRPVYELIRKCGKYREWVQHALKRDKYQCVLCGINGTLDVDHIKPLSIIVQENDIQTLEQALDCIELWENSNSRCLCRPCHMETETWGTKLAHS